MPRRAHPIQCIFRLHSECGWRFTVGSVDEIVAQNSDRHFLRLVILLLVLGCGDQYRPVANPIIGPGGQPQPAHYAYVVSNNPTGDGSAMQLDVSGDSVASVQTTGLGSNYESFLSTSAAAVFVTNGGDDTVSEFNVSMTGAVTTINLPIGSHPVAVTSTQIASHVRS